jgi:cytochrome P450
MLPPLPPGPRSRFGLRELRRLRRNPLAFLEQLRSFGTIAATRIGPQLVYLASEPDLIEAVLTSHEAFTKGRALQRAKQLLGEGLLTSEGEHHLRARRLVQPAFHRSRVQIYAQAMCDLAWEWSIAQRAGTPIDLAREMHRLTLRIVARALFGANVDRDADAVAEALTTVIEQFALAVLPWTALLDRLPLPRRFRFERAQAALDTIVFRLIAEHRRDDRDRGDLLSMLLAARDEERAGMTDRQVRDEVLTLFLAGHETTANALTWTWTLVSRHPDVAERLAEEAVSVCGAGPVTPDHVNALTYTRMVLSEGMRLYPPAWVLGRRAVGDWSLGSFDVPSGGLILMSPWTMHRDPRFFEDPLAFNPNRWLPEVASRRPKFSYFPFGGGNRVCIGEHFAWTEGVIVLAAMALRWRVQVDQSQPFTMRPGITLRPAGPIVAMLEPTARLTTAAATS